MPFLIKGTWGKFLHEKSVQEKWFRKKKQAELPTNSFKKGKKGAQLLSGILNSRNMALLGHFNMSHTLAIFKNVILST